MYSATDQFPKRTKFQNHLELLAGLLLGEAVGEAEVGQVALGVAQGAAGLALHVGRHIAGAGRVPGQLVAQRTQEALGVAGGAGGVALGVAHGTLGATLGVVDGAGGVAHLERLVHCARRVAHLVLGHGAAKARLRLRQILLGFRHGRVGHVLDVGCGRGSGPA